MLTAIRELAEEAEAHRGLQPAELLPKLVARGEDTVLRTTEMLDVLKEANVVDSGAAGLVEIVRGISAALNGEELPTAPQAHEDHAVQAMHQELSQYRYCTVFLVEGENLDAETLEERAGRARRLAARRRRSLRAEGARAHRRSRAGALARRRTRARSRASRSRTCTSRRCSATSGWSRRCRGPGAGSARPCVAVTVGPGNRRALREPRRACVVDGGQTMNPSTAELLAAIEALARRRGGRAAEQLATSS